MKTKAAGTPKKARRIHPEPAIAFRFVRAFEGFEVDDVVTTDPEDLGSMILTRRIPAPHEQLRRAIVLGEVEPLSDTIPIALVRRLTGIEEPPASTKLVRGRGAGRLRMVR